MKNQPPAFMERAQAAIKYIANAGLFAPEEYERENLISTPGRFDFGNTGGKKTAFKAV